MIWQEFLEPPIWKQLKKIVKTEYKEGSFNDLTEKNLCTLFSEKLPQLYTSVFCLQNMRQHLGSAREAGFFLVIYILIKGSHSQWKQLDLQKIELK